MPVALETSNDHTEQGQEGPAYLFTGEHGRKTAGSSDDAAACSRIPCTDCQEPAQQEEDAANANVSSRESCRQKDREDSAGKSSCGEGHHLNVPALTDNATAVEAAERAFLRSGTSADGFSSVNAIQGLQSQDSTLKIQQRLEGGAEGGAGGGAGGVFFEVQYEPKSQGGGFHQEKDTGITRERGTAPAAFSGPGASTPMGPTLCSGITDSVGNSTSSCFSARANFGTSVNGEKGHAAANNMVWGVEGACVEKDTLPLDKVLIQQTTGDLVGEATSTSPEDADKPKSGERLAGAGTSNTRGADDEQGHKTIAHPAVHRHHILKVLYGVTLYRIYTRALTFENLWQGTNAANLSYFSSARRENSNGRLQFLS